MNYNESLAYLAEAGKRGWILGLDTIRNLLRHLGNPQQALKFVHIAGTNGKGSTTAMIASIAAAAGILTGRYTSPAVFCDREKYAVNGEWISENTYAACMEQIARAVERMAAEGLSLPTAFEIETALAILHFAQSGCELAVLETGMGGETDATNVIGNTLVCVLTAIGMDHTKFLGGTLGEITAKKAGIIKPGSRVVLEKQSDEVVDVVASACQRANAALFITEPETIRLINSGVSRQRFSYRGLEVSIPLTGRFQLDNAAAAIDAALQLRECGYSISDEAIIAGLKAVSWPGRLQQIHAQPDIFIDGAHNPNAARRLAEAIPLLWPDRELICIMGVLADKDFTEVAQLVCGKARRVITVTPNNPRALDAESLARAVRPFCSDAEPAASVSDALQKAIRYADEKSVILAFGSLSYLNEIVITAKEL